VREGALGHINHGRYWFRSAERSVDSVVAMAMKTAKGLLNMADVISNRIIRTFSFIVFPSDDLSGIDVDRSIQPLRFRYRVWP
jgi:hypothetical protein